jgi:hypothetical protein
MHQTTRQRVGGEGQGADTHQRNLAGVGMMLMKTKERMIKKAL